MSDTNVVDLFKYARLYLGPDNWEFIRKTSKEELLIFQSIDLNTSDSYFVKGNNSLLNKFKAFYLTRCLKKKPLYTQCSIYEYADGVCSADKDEFGLGVAKDLLFLYMHEHISSIGNSRKWLTETVVNRIADRNRIGLVTVILSETKVPEFEECGELKIIDLSSAQTSSSKANMENYKGGNTFLKGNYD